MRKNIHELKAKFGDLSVREKKHFNSFEITVIIFKA